MNGAVNLHDFEALAHARLSDPAAAYLAGGAGDLADHAEAALAVDEHAFLFTPAGRRRRPHQILAGGDAADEVEGDGLVAHG